MLLAAPRLLRSRGVAITLLLEAGRRPARAAAYDDMTNTRVGDDAGDSQIRAEAARCSEGSMASGSGSCYPSNGIVDRPLGATGTARDQQLQRQSWQPVSSLAADG